MKRLQIRDVQKEDMNEIYELACMLTEKELNKKKFAGFFYENITNSFMHYKIAVLDEKITGYIAVSVQSPLHHAEYVAEIQELIVAPEYRSRNIGKKLLDEAYKTSVNSGCAAIELASNKKRVRAHKFYENNGFESTHFKFVRNINKQK